MAALFLSLSCICDATYWGDKPGYFDKSLWSPICASPDTIAVYWISSNGDKDSEKCFGVWYSERTKQYLLTWKNSKKVVIDGTGTRSFKYYKLRNK